jgi:hypothetical protein
MWITPGISIFGGWPSSLVSSGGAFIWYGVYDSPAVCHRREPIISKILGCIR